MRGNSYGRTGAKHRVTAFTSPRSEIRAAITNAQVESMKANASAATQRQRSQLGISQCSTPSDQYTVRPLMICGNRRAERTWPHAYTSVKPRTTDEPAENQSDTGHTPTHTDTHRHTHQRRCLTSAASSGSAKQPRPLSSKYSTFTASHSTERWGGQGDRERWEGERITINRIMRQGPAGKDLRVKRH